MTIRVVCQRCGRGFHQDVAHDDRRHVRCPACGHDVALPGAGHQPATRPAEETDVGLVPLEPGEAAVRGVHHAPEVEQALREEEVAERQQGPYVLDPGYVKPAGTGHHIDSRPASEAYVRWRWGVVSILRALRFIDQSGYLLSLPFVALLAVGFLGGSWSKVHIAAVVIVLLNGVRFVVDGAYVVVKPFREGPLHGVACLFPPYALYYLASRWKEMKKPLRRWLWSLIPIALVVLAYAFLPALTPEVANETKVSDKLRSGARELGREVRTDVKDAEGAIEREGKQIEEEVR